MNDRRIVPQERIDPPANHDDWTEAFFSSDFGWVTPLCPDLLDECDGPSVPLPAFTCGNGIEYDP
jgi:hypothetical protein